MDIQQLAQFFMWMTVINVSMLAVWIIMFAIAKDRIYNLHIKLFPIPREKYNITVFSFLAIFKILFIILNFVPYIAILIIA